MRRISRSGLEAELCSIMEHKWGIGGAEELKLPLLERHPAVHEQMDSKGKFSLEEALRRVLLDVINQLEPQTMAEALRWEFAAADGSGGHGQRARTKKALELSKLSKDEYSHDTRKPGTNRLQREGQRTRAVKQIAKWLEALERRPTAQTNLRNTTESKPRPPQTPRSIRIGRLEITHAISIASCDRGQSSTRELLLEFEQDLRPGRLDPVAWPLLEAQLVPVLEEEARERIAKFENDPALDLVHVEHRPSTANGASRYSVGVAETNYYLWAATANSLDRELSHFPDLTKCLGDHKLRDAWNCDPTSLGDLTRLPAPAFIGVCVVIIAEGQIMVLERRSDHHVASTAKGIPAHFMGEGMLPEDIEAGRFSPTQAALRGCLEELGVGPNHFKFIPTGLIIDTKRWQPLFCFIGECDLSIPELEKRMKNAPHAYETGYGKIIARLPWTAQNEKTLALLTGYDPTLSLASNHAQVALLHALYYRDGRDEVDDLLERDTA
jgi:hypothetical protein